MADLRYPIGRYEPPSSITPAHREEWIQVLENLPANMERSVRGLTGDQLDTRYRPGGWTVRQVVHHVPDSHLNSYTRFRLALTEDSPLIKGYEESAWAELLDAKTAPVDLSLDLLKSLHARWVLLLRSLEEKQWNRTFVHPSLGELTLNWTLGLYAWHSRHHLAHINNLRKREGWMFLS